MNKEELNNLIDYCIMHSLIYDGKSKIIFTGEELLHEVYNCGFADGQYSCEVDYKDD